MAAALSLHNNGISDITILEAAPRIEPLGVGVNLPPHATRELHELGLEQDLESVGIKTSNLAYYDPAGTEIWTEARGLNDGYKWPQYSIHRGKINRNGLGWRDAPREYGPHKTLCNRWKRWSGKGVFARMMAGLAADHGEKTTVMIDATYPKAHRTASGLGVEKGGVVA